MVRNSLIFGFFCIYGIILLCDVSSFKLSYLRNLKGLRSLFFRETEISAPEGIVVKPEYLKYKILDKNNLSLPLAISEQKLPLAIRRATLHDLNSVINLRMQVFYPTFRTDNVFRRNLLDKIRMRFDKGSVSLLASCPVLPRNLQLGYIVGTVEVNDFAFKNTSMDSIGRERKLYIGDLAVRVDAQRRGVASQLLDEVELYAKANNYNSIYLHVETTNAPAMSLYLKKNYVELPLTATLMQFTEQHLQLPGDSYCILFKDMSTCY